MTVTLARRPNTQSARIVRPISPRIPLTCTDAHDVVTIAPAAWRAVTTDIHDRQEDRMGVMPTLNGLPVAVADFPPHVDWALMSRDGRRLILRRRSMSDGEWAAASPRVLAATAETAS